MKKVIILRRPHVPTGKDTASTQIFDKKESKTSLFLQERMASCDTSNARGHGKILSKKHSIQRSLLALPVEAILAYVTEEIASEKKETIELRVV